MSMPADGLPLKYDQPLVSTHRSPAHTLGLGGLHRDRVELQGMYTGGQQPSSQADGAKILLNAMTRLRVELDVDVS